MYIKNCSLMRVVQAYAKQFSVIEQRRFMYIKNYSLMRVVKAFSKQCSLIEQRRSCISKTAL